jgi:hypothetical protein
MHLSWLVVCLLVEAAAVAAVAFDLGKRSERLKKRDSVRVVYHKYPAHGLVVAGSRRDPWCRGCDGIRCDDCHCGSLWRAEDYR